jgi:hypothetical protein
MSSFSECRTWLYIYNIHVDTTDRHEITEILLKVALNTILPIYKVEVLVYFSSQWRDEYLIYEIRN